MERFGVSRNSLREALKSLQAMAFRTVVGHRRGEGSLLELLHLREALEAGLMYQLAGRLPDEDLAELDALVETMHTEVREAGEIAARTDRAFHRVRAQAEGLGTAADGEEPAGMHARIVDAVRAGGAEAAERAVHRHFDDIRGRLSQH